MEMALAGLCILAAGVVAVKCVSSLERTLERVTDAMTALADKDAAAQVSEMRQPPAAAQPPANEGPDPGSAGGWDPRFAGDLHDVASSAPMNGTHR
jgi:hypothetical protein